MHSYSVFSNDNILKNYGTISWPRHWIDTVKIQNISTPRRGPHVALFYPHPLPSLSSPPLPPIFYPWHHYPILHWYNFVISRMFYKSNHIVCNLFGLAFFTQNSSLESHPSYCMRRWIVPFYCWVVFHGMDVPQFIWSTIHWRTARLLPSVALVDQTPTNIPWTKYSYSSQGHALVHPSYLPRKTTLEVILIWF